MFKFSYNCTEALVYSRQAYETLYEFYDELEAEAKKQKDIADFERQKRLDAEYKANKEERRKKRWRNIAVGEGSAILVIVTLIVLL